MIKVIVSIFYQKKNITWILKMTLS